MPDPIRDVPGGAVHRPRRAVLALGLAAGGSLWAGCTLSDPTVRARTAGPPSAGASGGTATPSPTPTPRPPGSGTPADATAELALAASAARLGGGSRLSGRQRALLQLVARTHRERATALASADPVTRPTAPDASPAPSVRPAASSPAELADAERRLAGRYRTAALAASGLTALLWGSMSVASNRFADALDADEPPASGKLRPHRPATPVSDADAVAALVAALHASVYGYQLALGKLPVSSRAHERALAGLRDRRALQDRLTARLVDAGVEVPPAAPAYDPDPEVRDAATAARLVQRMELALLPFCGLWLAAAGRAGDRRAAFDALAGTAATAGSWGAPLQPWPGWQD